ncbi:PLP-dependent aminotransferase family protein [Leisingera sp. ANG59]|uniref:MocR-like pyridoxine biosynthesis transcription factor PdxR n=1 Tax=Leisingera sp. ANG59 TaxID=2675221 RepID=UPI0015728721|nr:PLP-dependent aminotransferase family protein [Leisingera sp. ANG59]NSY39140.1 aminotransferase class I/II-fold pyridoxal phosphate-dependent enzyme [Leisingera sp. ANG59]
MIDLSGMISDSKAEPLYLQIVEALRSRISEGSLGLGTRLPSSRALAQDLGVARSTVVTAYDQLVAEGFAETRQGAGVFVCDVAPIRPPEVPAKPIAAAPPPAPGMLVPGAPDPEVFPARPWARCVSRVARMDPLSLSHQEDAFGDPELRREIAAYAARWRGIDCSAEQVLVTSGAREALELAMEFLVEGGDIALEAPGFTPTRRFAQARGWRVHWLRAGPRGAEVPRQMAKVTLLTPSHQFPLGGTLPVPQRQAFLHAAKARGGWVIEDDFDSEFRYCGQPVPAMAALDREGRCIYVGTFSKTFSHALRLGYAILPPALVAQFRAQFTHPSAGAAITAQRPLAEFMASGQYDRHIRRARRLYAERYAAAAEALAEWPEPLGSFHRHNAGMQIAFHLKGTQGDICICRRAAEAGYGIRPLSPHDPDGTAQGLLIGFCQSQAEDLPYQIAGLRRIVENAS